MRVFTGGRRSKLLRCPVQRLYPVELSARLDSDREQENTTTSEVIPTTTPGPMHLKTSDEGQLEELHWKLEIE